MMRIKLWARVAALLIVLTFCGWMVVLMTFGVSYSVVTELPLHPIHNDGLLDSQFRRTLFQPYLPAIIPMTLALITGVGLLNDRVIAISWIGVGLLTLIGFPLIFGLGLFCWGLAALISVPLSILQSQIQRNPKWLIAGAVGTAILLWGGAAFIGGAIGWIALAAGGISALLLAWLIVHTRQQQAVSG